ncbi:TIR domain-containing protein [Patescibacteria group bacterium]
MTKKVFISFDFDNDKGIKNFVMGQAKLPTSPFWGADWSMKEAAPQSKWEDEAERRIKKCDIVLVMVGEQTHKASGVLKEVELARQYKKLIAQIIAYPDIINPTPVDSAGRLYRWNWDNLKTLLN